MKRPNVNPYGDDETLEAVFKSIREEELKYNQKVRNVHYLIV